MTLESTSRTGVVQHQASAESTLKAAAFEQLPLPAGCVDPSGRILAVNCALAALLGLELESSVGLSMFDAASATRRSRLAGRWPQFWRQLQQRDSTGTLCWRHPDGRRLCLRFDARRTTLGATEVALLTVQDISAERRSRRERLARETDATKRLEQREQLLELAAEPGRDLGSTLSRVLRTACRALGLHAAGFWSYDGTTKRLRCQSMFVADKDRLARDWVDVEFPSELAPNYLAALSSRRALAIDDLSASRAFAALSRRSPWACVHAMLDAPVLVDGHVHGALTLYDDKPHRWNEEETGFATTAALIIALAVAATQRQQAERRVEQLAWYDPLTGLPNRNLLRESLRDLLAGAADRQGRVALLLIDLDRFKNVNATLGHLVGDALVKAVAQVLRAIVGSGGLVGRLGGDEFLVVLTEFEHRQQVAEHAARLIQSLHRTDLVAKIDTQVSASIGIALFPEHGREMSTLLKNADSAMYQAKRDGRNQASFFNPIRHDHVAREVQLGIQLAKALQAPVTQLFVEYQPQVHVESGRVVGLAGLLRWQHPELGQLTSDQFVAVADANGLTEQVTRWLLGEACTQILRWRARQPGFDIPIALHVEGTELGSASLPALLRSAIAAHGIEPSMILLEVGGRAFVRQGEIQHDVLTELASLGIGLVLDDFGAGYSMLGHLKRLPLRALKIDAAFVQGVPQNADNCAIVQALLGVARHFHLRVIAKGVETAAQVEYLCRAGCGYAEGFYYSPPLRPQSILDHIEIAPPDSTPRSPV